MTASLHELAALYRVQPSYHDAFGVYRTAPPEALVAILRALGAPIERPDDADDAIRARRDELAARSLPPCIVASDGRAELPRGVVALEGGGERAVDGHVELPIGYHTLHTDGGATAAVLAAPARCWTPDPEPRAWGAFAPLYAVRTERSVAHGGADLGDLRAAVQWTADRGGAAFGTLPLLASFLDREPVDPSPYLPVSRRFWNELYLELDAPGDAALAAELAELRDVDYGRLAALRRRLIAARAADPAIRDELEQWAAANPDVDEYASFRAVCERRREPWACWPERLPAVDVDPDARRYHLYAQREMRRQLEALAATEHERGCALYLDLPVGAHPDGFDTWREGDAFCRGVAAGAPPDGMFAGGQDWGLPPLHPERPRAGGHSYLAACVREHLRYAGALRIDHVMGLHRLFWVPTGMTALDGAYVYYATDEQFAVLAIESHRAQARIVGEDLGTVPDEVRHEMEQRRVARIYVAQFSMRWDGGLDAPPASSVASVNTHDIPPLAGFWDGVDIDARVKLGLIDEDAARGEREGRQHLVRGFAADPQAALAKIVRELAPSEAWLVLLNLEDLWGERRAQNQPGTTSIDYPNWRHKLHYTLEQLAPGGEGPHALLDELAAARTRR